MGNLVQKIKNAPFSMNIATQLNLKVLISNPILDFQNVDPKLFDMGTIGLKLKILLFLENWQPTQFVGADFKSGTLNDPFWSKLFPN